MPTLANCKYHFVYCRVTTFYSFFSNLGFCSQGGMGRQHLASILYYVDGQLCKASIFGVFIVKDNIFDIFRWNTQCFAFKYHNQTQPPRNQLFYLFC